MEGPVGICVCRRRRRGRLVRHAADLRRAVVQALAPADHAPGEAEQDGRRGSGRRHLAGLCAPEWYHVADRKKMRNKVPCGVARSG